VHTPLLGADVVYAEAAQHRLPVDPDFEHGVLVMSGAVTARGQRGNTV
jgi:quercetin 2,3-dioxygenase